MKNHINTRHVGTAGCPCCAFTVLSSAAGVTALAACALRSNLHHILLRRLSRGTETPTRSIPRTSGATRRRHLYERLVHSTDVHHDHRSTAWTAIDGQVGLLHSARQSPASMGETITGFGEDFWDNYPSSLNRAIDAGRPSKSCWAVSCSTAIRAIFPPRGDRRMRRMPTTLRTPDGHPGRSCGRRSLESGTPTSTMWSPGSATTQ